MKLSSVAVVLSAGMAVNANWLSQFIFKADTAAIENEIAGSKDTAKDDAFTKLRTQLGNPKHGYMKEVVDAWDYMMETMNEADLQAKIDQFSKRPVSTFNNQLNDNRNPKASAKKGEFHTVSDEKFEGYSLDIKKNHPESLGLDSVEQYTGYLNVDQLDKHFFFWFFESRSDPKNDPVILWLNGGPGCSSSTGLFFELGPSSINATIQPEFNPYSWNSKANVIFLDQPVGVGYSYTGGDEIKSTAAAAKDFFVFLELFFQKFPEFKGNKFHIAGESYAGHYIPSFASEILNNADRSFELSSVLIGNGITDPLVQYKYYRPMACGEGGYKSVLTPEVCDQMDKDYPKCALLTKLCYQFEDTLSCVAATTFCETKLYGPYDETGLNPYDIRKKCADQGGDCYAEMGYVDEFLNSEYVKEVVGAKVDIFTSCDDTVFRNFILSGDEMKPFQQYVAEILEKDVPVLLYAGDKDFICNWLGNHAWSDELEYSKHEPFSYMPMLPWFNKETGKFAGQVKNFDKFTFARVFDAGHMVPFDQPANALDMVNKWISGDYSLQGKYH